MRTPIIISVHSSPARDLAKTSGSHGTLLWRGSPIRYESRTERALLLLLTVDPQVVAIESQPFTIVFQIDGGRRRFRYTPDFRVVRNLTRPWVWGDLPLAMTPALVIEVKRKADIERQAARLARNCRAMNAWSAQTHESFQLVLDTCLWQIQLANAELIHAWAGQVAFELSELLRSLEPSPLEAILVDWARAVGRNAAKIQIFAALRDGWIYTDLSKPIGPESVFRTINRQD